MKKYQNKIGDGKLPNIYYVFQYDEKAIRNGFDLEYPNKKVDGGYVGQFKSYKKALKCVNEKTFYPHVLIEDRLTGIVFEQYVEVCNCCGHKTYKTIEDIVFTKSKLGDKFQ